MSTETWMGPGTGTEAGTGRNEINIEIVRATPFSEAISPFRFVGHMLEPGRGGSSRVSLNYRWRCASIRLQSEWPGSWPPPKEKQINIYSAHSHLIALRLGRHSLTTQPYGIWRWNVSSGSLWWLPRELQWTDGRWQAKSAGQKDETIKRSFAQLEHARVTADILQLPECKWTRISIWGWLCEHEIWIMGFSAD